MNEVSFKNRAIAAARALRLLSTVDRIKLLLTIARNARRNAAFRDEFPGYAVPRYSDAYDAYSHIDWRLYRESGIEHAGILADVIRLHLGEKPLQVLEWGCGPGRVIRHLAERLPPDSSLYGTDINPSTIEWCDANLPGIDFRTNGLQPPLDFKDESMDVIIARSVFTHLSEENHLLWKRELLRVLRPGGILVATTSGDFLAGLHLTPPEREVYDAGKLVVRSGVLEGTKWYAAFHSPAFMRSKMWDDVSVLEHRSGPLCHSFAQDLWVLQKPLSAVSRQPI